MLELQNKMPRFSLYWLKCCKIHSSFKAPVLPLLVRTKLPSTPEVPGVVFKLMKPDMQFLWLLNICGTSRGIYLLLSRRDLTQQLLTNAGTSDGDGGLGPNSWGERFEFTSPILSICKSESTWVCVVLGASGTWSGCCCLHLQLRRAFTMCDCAGGSDAEVASV